MLPIALVLFSGEYIYEEVNVAKNELLVRIEL